ncbi:MAG: SMI1/KNR4 family protein [Actinomycetia bacterium]|nr:SMI1/KNR4 family protein [Actinomycetes bacterium]
MTEQQPISPDRLLGDVIANHFADAQVLEEDGTVTVHLGEGLPQIICWNDHLSDKPPYGAFIFLRITGGALGESGALVTASGYADSQPAAIITAGCTWACAFGPVLLTALGHADRICSEDPQVDELETVLQGRRYRVTISSLDRGGNVTAEQVAAYRQSLGGLYALTRRVLDSGTIPATRGNRLIALGAFAGIGPQTSNEVKLGTLDWHAARAVLDAIPPEPQGLRLLREWALLTPLEPAPPLTRESLQHSLDLIAATQEDSDSEAGWLGARRHQMRLGAPLQTLPVPGLPDDLVRFLTTVAGSGAGPGYGLDVRPLAPGWVHLAGAGCGAFWALDLAGGSVWLDARACSDETMPVASSFTAWYDGWLDNAIHGGGPYARWEFRADAAYQLLAGRVNEVGVEKVAQELTEVRLQGPDQQPVGPCHACERTYAYCGVPSTVFGDCA